MKITLATWVTLARLAMIPIIALFYLGAVHFVNSEFFAYYGRLIAMILFVVAAATDWLDGYIARKRGEVTELGKILDPIADKLLVVLGFALIVTDPFLLDDFDNILPVWFAVIFLVVNIGRDYVISALRQISSSKGHIIAADKFGKAKTITQFAAITLYMLYAVNVGFNNRIVPLGLMHELHIYFSWTMMVVATVLSVLSCVNYILNYKRAMREKAVINCVDTENLEQPKTLSELEVEETSVKETKVKKSTKKVEIEEKEEEEQEL